jgi:hypothetical protein
MSAAVLPFARTTTHLAEICHTCNRPTRLHVKTQPNGRQVWVGCLGAAPRDGSVIARDQIARAQRLRWLHSLGQGRRIAPWGLR